MRKKRRFERQLKKHSKQKPAAPKSTDEFFAMSEHDQDQWIRVTHAVSKIREGTSASQAAREFELDLETLVRLGGPSLHKDKYGRYIAKAVDRLLRVLNTLTPDGLVEVATRDSREASKQGQHATAVHRYLQTGDDSALQKFQNQYITDANGVRVYLLTDTTCRRR
jgi:hypothetical protein